MNRRTKLWIQFITGILFLLGIFWIPEFAVILGMGMIVLYILKKLWNVPIIKIKRK